MMNKNTITAQCIIKNEENFIESVIMSVVDYVDKIIIFDTGSTDQTVSKIKILADRYSEKIIFEEKGDCTKEMHSSLRQEILEKTQTDWFMILDGDEVYTKRGIIEALAVINSRNDLEWLVSPYYLCVGDVYHTYYKEWEDKLYGRTGFFTPRFIKKIDGLYWSGYYEQDTIYKKDGSKLFNNKKLYFLKNKYWHLTHLKRSSSDHDVYTSGIEKTRHGKMRLTYLMIGKKILESIPESLVNFKKMTYFESVLNFFKLLFLKPRLFFRRIVFKLKIKS